MGYRKVRQQSLLIVLALVGLDLIFMAGLYELIVLFRNYIFGNGGEVEASVIFAIFVSSAFPLAMIGGYNTLTPMNTARFFSEHAIASALSFILGFALVYSITTFGRTGTSAARANVGIVLLVFPLFSLLYRASIYRRLRKRLEKQVLFVVGEGVVAQDFFQMLKNYGWVGEHHFFSIRKESAGEPLDEKDEESPILRDHLVAAVGENLDNLHSVVIASDLKDIPGEYQRLLMNLHFRETVVQSFYSFCSNYWRFVPISQLSLWWVIDDGFRLNRDLTFERVKRFTDLVLSGSALLVLSPLLLLTAMAVRLDSPGPAIFRQLRSGLNESSFMIYKFRTMRTGAESEDKYTRKNDTRITRIGHFLRKTRIDELPQLWNVFRGDMSIIGPRAEWVELVNSYENKIPYYHFRHLVKPGITGWAQVNYSYGENLEDTIEKLKYDLYYVRHYSFNLDMSIVFKTIYTMLGGKGQ